jgi:hypothetical protein
MGYPGVATAAVHRLSTLRSLSRSAAGQTRRGKGLLTFALRSIRDLLSIAAEDAY